MDGYELSVGMEVHAELLTETKMFCRCRVDFGGEPNSRVCPVCLGLPGALPVPNKRAIELVVKTALALNCTVPKNSIFHRKNYFYPDIPKGYQTSQYGDTNPLGYNGHLEITTEIGGAKRIKIRRVHLEEDTGKLTHLGQEGSGIDFNRAGVPLMEIVTEFPPDISSVEESKEYLVRLREILVWIGACDGKMEQGSLRCEPNISVRPTGSDNYGTKTEVKNLNSFKSVQLAVDREFSRQSQELSKAHSIRQETRGWDESKLDTYVMRSKETEADYRYFPCPDLAPMVLTEEFVQELREELPVLPDARRRHYVKHLGLSTQEAFALTQDRAWSDFFEQVCRAGAEPKTACNLLNSEFAKNLHIRDLTVTDPGVPTPRQIAALAQLIDSGTLSSKGAKTVMVELFERGGEPIDIVDRLNLTQVSDASFLIEAVKSALVQNPGPAKQVADGDEKVIGFLVGQVMKATQGRANPSLVHEELRRQLNL